MYLQLSSVVLYICCVEMAAALRLRHVINLGRSLSRSLASNLQQELIQVQCRRLPGLFLFFIFHIQQTIYKTVYKLLCNTV